MPPGTIDPRPYNTLLCAVLVRAIRDTRSRAARIRRDADLWLASDIGRAFADYFNVGAAEIARYRNKPKRKRHG